MTARKIDWGKGRKGRLVADDLPPHVSIDEAALILGCPRHLIDSLVSVGHVPIIYAAANPPPDPEPRFLTRAEAALILQISEPSLDKAIQNGLIPVVRVTDRGVRINAVALAQLGLEFDTEENTEG